jgi:replicative DNA helicase
MPRNEQLPPTIEAPEIEKFVLGAAIGGKIEISSMSVQLNAADFAHKQRRAIFQSLCKLHEAGEPTDIGTLTNDLRPVPAFADVAIITLLSGLQSGIPAIDSSVVENWFRILRDKANRRKLVAAADKYQRLAYGTNEIGEILGGLNNTLDEIADSQVSSDDLQTPSDVFEEHGGINTFFDPQANDVIPTPWRELNYHLGGGYRAGELVVLAARPSIGKSAHSMQQAVFSAFTDIGTVVYPLEMKSRQLLLRAISSRARVDGMAVRRSEKLDPLQRMRLVSAASDFNDLSHLLISKRHRATVGSIESSLRKAKSMGFPLRLVVIDYLQLLSSSLKSENRVQEISSMTRSLKIMAFELNIVVLLLSQLSRDNVKQNRRPMLSDLTDAGTIEQDADIVQFLHWERQEQERHLEVRPIENILAKQREGPIDTIDLNFHTKFCEFRSLNEMQEAA